MATIDASGNEISAGDPKVRKAAIFIACLQFVFTIGWTIYVVYLPQLAAKVGLPGTEKLYLGSNFFSHGAEWNTLISRYIGTIPAMEVGWRPQIIPILSSPTKAVMIAIAAKLGAAAICNHAAMRSVISFRDFNIATGTSA